MRPGDLIARFSPVGGWFSTLPERPLFVVVRSSEVPSHRRRPCQEGEDQRGQLKWICESL